MRAVAVILAPLVFALACGSFGSSDDPVPPVPPPPEAGTNPPCGTVFVAQQAGDDARQGCEQTAPMKTIAAAISRAKIQGAHEIHVCSATYDEQALLLDTTISLHGGYDCASWQKTGAETRITRTGSSSDAVTFTVSSAFVTHDAEIDGFAIDGPSEGTTGTAVVVKDGATPFLHDLNMTGGGTAATSTAPGAVGLAILNGSGPEVTHSTISGGRGSAPAGVPNDGAIGIRVLASSPWLHDLTIDASKTPTNVEGLEISDGSMLTGANAISKVHVSWSSASNFAIGINVAGSNTHVEIVDSTIDMTDITCDTDKACAMVGIFAANADLKVRRNKIAGNNISGGTGGAPVTGIGVIAAAISIENNLIFGGNDRSSTGVAVNAIDLSQSPNAKVLYNTIATGPGAQATAVKVRGSSTGVIIDGNVFASPATTVLELFTCDGSSVASFYGNAILGAPTITNIKTQCDGAAGMAASTVVAAETALALAGQQNRRFAPACGSEVRCTALSCPAGGDCTGAIFTGGRASRDALLQDGWKLRPDVPCLLAKPSFAESADGSVVMTDLYGTVRTTPFSVGAVESEACVP